MKADRKIIVTVLALLLYLSFAQAQSSQDSVRDDKESTRKEFMIQAAKAIMAEAKYCALITIAENGFPQPREMDPFLPDSNLTVWFGTNRNSRKVNEIRRNSSVALYYQAAEGNGYVSLKGMAVIVDDDLVKQKRWKKEWASFYTENRDNYILIKVEALEMEVVSYKHKLVGDTVNWSAPGVEFTKPR